MSTQPPYEYSCPFVSIRGSQYVRVNGNLFPDPILLSPPFFYLNPEL